MPTGYTSKIAEGQTFEQFVWSCARGMGALITMRDEPMDAPIPERIESTSYHKENARQAQEEIARLDALDPAAAHELAHTYYATRCAEYEARKTERVALKAKYEAILARLRGTQFPASLAEFVGFMEQQINESIKFDCNMGYESPPALMSGAQYLAQERKDAQRRLEYHEREHVAEVKRMEERNAWLRDLRTTVPLPKGGV